MLSKITLTPISPVQSEKHFDQHFRPDLEIFLREQCLLDAAGISRVMPAVREIFTRTCFQADCALGVPARLEGRFKGKERLIVNYVQTYGQDVCDGFRDALREVRNSMLQEACRQLASLDEQLFRRPLN